MLSNAKNFFTFSSSLILKAGNGFATSKPLFFIFKKTTATLLLALLFFGGNSHCIFIGNK